ncbi:hypothetical protein OOU_Y34scaffold00011g4 [Pyricularia oryzae Y34]|uniref:Uncharacterized protein n=1 Tax=Pyricularia oryzae (strain Y34) TaxID=1143189 RepID=A0AA97PAP1_PYRO3|nr:hypothetical protein OOU_Y34scaffold00011g4 [Pyricularia oryzae Y34]
MAGEKSSTAPAVTQTTIDTRQPASAAAQDERAPSTPASEDATHLDEKEADRLGRQRPAMFSSTLIEVGFCATILLSMIMATIIA